MPNGMEDDIQRAVRIVRDRAYRRYNSDPYDLRYYAVLWALREVRTVFREDTYQARFKDSPVRSLVHTNPQKDCLACKADRERTRVKVRA